MYVGFKSVPIPKLSESVALMTSFYYFLFFYHSLNPHSDVIAGSVNLPPNMSEL